MLNKLDRWRPQLAANGGVSAVIRLTDKICNLKCVWLKLYVDLSGSTSLSDYQLNRCVNTPAHYYIICT